MWQIAQKCLLHLTFVINIRNINQLSWAVNSRPCDIENCVIPISLPIMMFFSLNCEQCLNMLQNTRIICVVYIYYIYYRDGSQNFVIEG